MNDRKQKNAPRGLGEVAVPLLALLANVDGIQQIRRRVANTQVGYRAEISFATTVQTLKTIRCSSWSSVIFPERARAVSQVLLLQEHGVNTLYCAGAISV